MTLNTLLVEDSLVQAEFYKTVLEEIGLTVHVVHNGKAGLNYAYAHHPDLIILDMNLPLMNGIDVCMRLKRDDETADIPVIMLTQRDNPDDALKAIKVGALDYIAKDEFAVDTLVSTLEQLGLVVRKN